MHFLWMTATSWQGRPPSLSKAPHTFMRCVRKSSTYSFCFRSVAEMAENKWNRPDFKRNSDNELCAGGVWTVTVCDVCSMKWLCAGSRRPSHFFWSLIQSFPLIFSPHPLILFSPPLLSLSKPSSLITFCPPVRHFLVSFSVVCTTADLAVCVYVCACLFVLVGFHLLFQLSGQSSCLLRTSETGSLNYAATSLFLLPLLSPFT